MKRRPRLLMALGLSLLLWAGTCVVCPSLRPGEWWLVTQGFGNRPFNVEVWRAADVEALTGNPRGAMLRSLLRWHPLVGLTRQQVGELLGPPDAVNGTWGPAGQRPAPREVARAASLHYLLGGYSGFGIDADVLILQFDARGRVGGWNVVQG